MIKLQISRFKLIENENSTKWKELIEEVPQSSIFVSYINISALIPKTSVLHIYDCHVNLNHCVDQEIGEK